MPYYTTITALDGKALKVCVPGPAIPSSSDEITYTNPRTKKKETTQTGIVAWTGSEETPCPKDAACFDWP
jgi:hypothetical protein